jgi:AcrR family transcriptional regulator
MILPMQNAILGPESAVPEPDPPEPGVAEQIARRSGERRTSGYAGEVRALMDAALSVMRQRGPSSRPRVADIVAAAGLSNDAFYRHFGSKDALVTALLQDGARQLTSYLGHQLAKESDPRAQVRRWVEGVMSQTGEEIAATTLAVLANGGGLGDGQAAGRHFASAPLGALLTAPFAALGCPAPELGSRMAAHSVLGLVSDYLWQDRRPTAADLKAVTGFCLAMAAGPAELAPTEIELSTTSRPAPAGESEEDA